MSKGYISSIKILNACILDHNPFEGVTSVTDSEIWQDRCPDVLPLNQDATQAILQALQQVSRGQKQVFSIAIASRKPPMYRKTIGSPYEAVVVPISKTPRSGNKITGSNEVTGSGIASVIHHTAIHAVTAATIVACGLIPDGWRKKENVKKSSGPNQNPIFFVVVVSRIS